MDGLQIVVSIVSGGLAGGCISQVSNRVFYWRALRTQFHPELNNIMGEYFVRLERPEGRYWKGRVGYLPSPEDESFVRHRSAFIATLPKFNELREARDLLRVLLNNPNPTMTGKGEEIETDLMPEYQAIVSCLDKVEGKLKL